MTLRLATETLVMEFREYSHTAPIVANIEIQLGFPVDWSRFSLAHAGRRIHMDARASFLCVKEATLLLEAGPPTPGGVGWYGGLAPVNFRGLA